MSAAAFRRLLEAGDVDGLVKAWAAVAPHLPRPETREQAEIAMHVARTAAISIEFRHRAWSHRWLTERDLPSHLPDDLKPKAERMYPRIVEGVGISVNVRNPLLKPAAVEVRKAMEVAVEESFADGKKDPAFVTARMQEAREKTWRALMGASLPGQR